jgi:hypothetical protein
LGPEEYCPHCDNELSGYRTVQFGIDREEDETEDWDGVEIPTDFSEEAEGKDKVWQEADAVLRTIVDDQEEAPECPECKEYMAELGVQTVGGNFQPKTHPSIGKPLVNETFEVVWYVCPACFRTTSVMGQAGRDTMLERLVAQKKA